LDRTQAKRSECSGCGVTQHDVSICIGKRIEGAPLNQVCRDRCARWVLDRLELLSKQVSKSVAWLQRPRDILAPRKVANNVGRTVVLRSQTVQCVTTNNVHRGT